MALTFLTQEPVGDLGTPSTSTQKGIWGKSNLGEVDIPSFDFDLNLFSEILEQESIQLPTGAELAAQPFLRTVLGK